VNLGAPVSDLIEIALKFRVDPVQTLAIFGQSALPGGHDLAISLAVGHLPGIQPFLRPRDLAPELGSARAVHAFGADELFLACFL
jgi:hypothetical protein